MVSDLAISCLPTYVTITPSLTIMKSNFEIKNVYLKNANYYIELDKGLFAASYFSQVIIGGLEHDNQQQLKFMPKSVIIPASQFFDFVEVLLRAQKAYQTNSTESFEQLLYQHSPSYQLLALYNQYEERWNFSLRYKWFFKTDKKYLNRVACGTAVPIKTENDQDFIFLPRGYLLDKDQVNLLCSQLNALLQHTFFDNEDVKQKVKDFIDYVVGHPEHCQKLKEKFMDYRKLTFKDKSDILEDLLNCMFQDFKKSPTSFEACSYLECLTNKTNLVFSLFNYHINNQ